MKALFTFLGLLLISALAAGLLLGNADTFYPSVQRAKAEKLRAEADALQAQTAYEERQRQLALATAEREAAAELEALQARHARQLELMGPLVTAGTVVFSIAALTLTAAVSYYLIVKARATGKGLALGRRQPAGQKPGLTPPQQRHGDTSGDDRDPPVQRANVRPDQVTYDGLLAYFHDQVLYPTRKRVFSPARIAPEVEATYLSILSDARIITWGTNGSSAWVLRRQINGIEDVRRRISREAFDGFMSSCSMPLPVDRAFLHRRVPQRERSPTPWSS